MVPFTLTTGGVHLVLASFLVLVRDHFALVPSGEPLPKVNLANLLSMFRVSSTPSILFFLLLSKDHGTLGALLVLTAIAFLTDLFDGFLSRRTGHVTKVGSYLDSMSDYGILLTLCFAVSHFGLISPWFFGITLLRFFGQGLAMATLLIYHGSVETRSTGLGKASVFATMITFALSLFELLPGMAETMGAVITIIEFPVGALLLLSFAEKLLLLRIGFRRAKGR